MVVTSNGGHFDVAVAVLPAFAGMHVELATYRLQAEFTDIDLGELSIRGVHLMSIWSVKVGPMLALSFLFNFVEAFRMLWRVRPDVVFSTGAEIAIPVALIGKLLFRAKLLHMETAVHPRKVSLTGRLLAPFCDSLYVQWPEAVAAMGSRATFAGRVF